MEIHCVNCKCRITYEFYSKPTTCNHIYCHECMKNMVMIYWECDEQIPCDIDKLEFYYIGIYNTADNNLQNTVSLTGYMYLLLVPKIPIFRNQIHDCIKGMFEMVKIFETKTVTKEMFVEKNECLLIDFVDKVCVTKLLDKAILLREGFLYEYVEYDFEIYDEVCDYGSEYYKSNRHWDRYSVCERDYGLFLNRIYEYFRYEKINARSIKQMKDLDYEYKLLIELKKIFVIIIRAYSSVLDDSGYSQFNDSVLKVVETKLSKLRSSTIHKLLNSFSRKLLEVPIFTNLEYCQLISRGVWNNSDCVICLSKVVSSFGRFSNCEHKLCSKCILKWLITDAHCPLHNLGLGTIIWSVATTHKQISVKRYLRTNLDNLMTYKVESYRKTIPIKFRHMDNNMDNFVFVLSKFNIFHDKFGTVLTNQSAQGQILQEFLSELSSKELTDVVGESYTEMPHHHRPTEDYRKSLATFKSKCGKENAQLSINIDRRILEFSQLDSIHAQLEALHCGYGKFCASLQEVFHKLQSKCDYWEIINYWWLSAMSLDNCGIDEWCSKLNKALKGMDEYRIYLTNVRRYKNVLTNICHREDIEFKDEFGVEDSSKSEESEVEAMDSECDHDQETYDYNYGYDDDWY